MRPLFADRILQPVDQAWFDDPFTLGKGLDVITPVRKAWGETHIVISIAGGVCDRLEDRPICEVADNGTLATDLFNGGCEDPERVVFDRDASYAESHHLVPRKGTLATVCSRDFNKSIELNGPHTAETVSASPDLHCRRPMADIGRTRSGIRKSRKLVSKASLLCLSDGVCCVRPGSPRLRRT